MNSVPPAPNGIRKGRITLLATTGAERSSIFTHVPAVAETLPGFVARGNTGLMTAPGTPDDIIGRLNAAMAAVIGIPEVRERPAAMSLKPMSTPPSEYQKLIAEEIDKWGRIMRDSGVVID